MGRLRHVLGWVFLLALGAGAAQAQPFIFYRGIVNAASFASQGLPNGSIARGSIFSIFGRNLGPAEGSTVSSFPLGTNFQGVSIEVCQNTNCVAALPLFVGASQINAIMPSNAPLGAVSVRVTFNGQAGNFSPATVAASSLGIFAINAGGFGPGVVQNFTPEALPVNSAVVTAIPGQAVIAWGTGLGAGLNADNVAPQGGDLPVNVEIWAGGKSVTVKRYNGRSPCCAGVDQIVFDLPPDTPAGCYVPIQIRTGGQVVSNSTTIAVAPDGQSCSDPDNAAGQAFRAGGRIGKVLLVRTLRFDNSSSTAELETDLATADFRQEPGGPWSFNPNYSLPPLGACTVQQRRGILFDAAPAPGTAPLGRALDAGQALSFTSGSRTVALPRRSGAITGYHALLGARSSASAESTLVLSPGVETRTAGTGGVDVGAWQATLAAPPAPSWTNRQQTAVVNRAAGVSVSWQSSQLGNDVVWIWGGNVDFVTDTTVTFSCIVPGQSGNFVVPASVLANLPPSRTRASQSKGWLGVGRLSSSALGTFQAQGLDTGLVGGYSQIVSTVRFN